MASGTQRFDELRAVVQNVGIVMYAIYRMIGTITVLGFSTCLTAQGLARVATTVLNGATASEVCHTGGAVVNGFAR